MISLIKNLKKDLKKKRLSIFAATTTLLANTSLCFAVENEIRSMNEIGHDALVHSLSFLGPRECTQAGEVNSFWHENSDLAQCEYREIAHETNLKRLMRREQLSLHKRHSESLLW